MSVNYRKIMGPEEISNLRSVLLFLKQETKKRNHDLGEFLNHAKTLSDQPEHNGWSQMDSAIEEYIDRRYRLDIFEQILYRSFALSVFAFIERDLRDLCMHLCKVTGQKFSIEDFGTPSMGKYVRYLEKITEGKFVSGHKNLQSAIVLRNLFAHGTKVPFSKQANYQKKIKGSCFQIKFDYNEPQIPVKNLDVYLDFAKEIYEMVTDNWVEQDKNRD